MVSPFDDADGTFLVVTNHQEQHALWPTSAPVPRGWAPAFGPASRAACAQYVAEHWTDLRPKRLADRAAEQ